MLMIRVFTALLVLLYFSACEKQKIAEGQAGDLVDATLSGKATISEINGRIENFGIDTLLQYDVEYYRIEYITIHEGQTIKVSGLVLKPVGPDTLSTVIYNHGTHPPLHLPLIINATPSDYSGEKKQFIEVYKIGLPLASAGFLVFMPDYTGYGSSTAFEHPFTHYQTLVQCIKDGLLASEEFLEKHTVSNTYQLFLTGWSQGAGASLFSHRYFQNNPSINYEIKASSSLSGPYDLKKFVLDILHEKDEKWSTINLFTWAFYAFNRYDSDLQRPTDQLFTYPVYDQVSATLPPGKKPRQVFNPFLIDQILNGNDKEFLQSLDDNSTYQNWLPKGKVFLHHGNADEVVPFKNSKVAFENLSKTSATVFLYEYEEGGHSDLLDKYVPQTILDFKKIQ